MMPQGDLAAEKYCLFLKDGLPDPSETNNLEQIDSGLKEHASPLVIHFHGGLVDKSAGRAGAVRLAKTYVEAGAHPVFYVWESGLLTHLQSFLPRVLRSDIFGSLYRTITQYVGGKVHQEEEASTPGARKGTSRLQPISWTEVDAELKKQDKGITPFENLDPSVVPEGAALTEQEQKELADDLSKDPDLKREANRIVSMAAGAAPPEVGGTRGPVIAPSAGEAETLLPPEILEEVIRAAGAKSAEPGTKGLLTFGAVAPFAWRGVLAAGRTISRFGSGRDHGVHATIVEELLRAFHFATVGERIWRSMKDTTAESFNGAGMGITLLQRLKTAFESGVPSRRIVLVAHSAGAIYACHFIRHADRVLPKDIKFDVVFLAPACDLRLFAETVVRSPHRIAFFRLFGMTDEAERKEWLLSTSRIPGLKYVYPGSLLYFVSGILEDEADKPILGMARFHEGGLFPDRVSRADLYDTDNFLKTFPKGRVWAPVQGDPGFASLSTTHGDFDNDQTTLDSIAHIIKG